MSRVCSGSVAAPGHRPDQSFFPHSREGRVAPPATGRPRCLLHALAQGTQLAGAAPGKEGEVQTRPTVVPKLATVHARPKLPLLMPELHYRAGPCKKMLAMVPRLQDRHAGHARAARRLPETFLGRTALPYIKHAISRPVRR